MPLLFKSKTTPSVSPPYSKPRDQIFNPVKTLSSHPKAGGRVSLDESVKPAQHGVNHLTLHGETLGRPANRYTRCPVLRSDIAPLSWVKRRFELLGALCDEVKCYCRPAVLERSRRRAGQRTNPRVGKAARGVARRACPKTPGNAATKGELLKDSYHRGPGLNPESFRLSGRALTQGLFLFFIINYLSAGRMDNGHVLRRALNPNVFTS